MALLASGCTQEDKTRLVAQCQLEADRVYPAAAGNWSAAVDHYVGTCMKAHGYHVDTRPCSPSSHVYTDERCYVPGAIDPTG